MGSRRNEPSDLWAVGLTYAPHTGVLDHILIAISSAIIWFDGALYIFTVPFLACVFVYVTLFMSIIGLGVCKIKLYFPLTTSSHWNQMFISYCII